MKQYKAPKPFIVDGPDIILENNDITYGIEMFEFDASKKFKHKGSSFKINEDQIFRNAENSQRKHYEESLTAKFTLDDYRKNVVENFNKHYANIENYIDNLIHDKNIKSKTIKICFVVVDKTPGNLIVKANNGNAFYTPLLDEDFVNNLYKKDKLDYLITFHCENYIQYPVFVSISKEHIKELKKRSLKNLTQNEVTSPAITKIIETF